MEYTSDNFYWACIEVENEPCIFEVQNLNAISKNDFSLHSARQRKIVLIFG